MAAQKVYSTIKPLVMTFIQELIKNYLRPLYHYVKEKPELINSAPGFLLNPEKIIVYVGRTHIAVEYMGSEVIQELKFKSEKRLKLEYHDYSPKECKLLEQIIGFRYAATVDFTMPLPPLSENLLLPTNKGLDKLLELGWNFAAQNSLMVFNTSSIEPMPGRFSRIINGLFFDANESGLKSRHIKWLDFLPMHFDDSDSEIDSISFSLEKMQDFVVNDAHYTYPMPHDYKFIHLPKINRFIEMWGNAENSETNITEYLSKDENKFILTMKFGARELYSNLICEWQSEDKKDIRPDFFVVQPNGYADIVEFKLPNINKKLIVGSSNRETFSAWLNSYISQTRVYITYFDDPNNRKWFEKKYGFKVHKPRRWLVVGRRDDFDANIWREIVSDYQDLEIMTYDDLIDGVVVQFYRQ